MASEAGERIIIPDGNGEEHLFEILLTFDVDETGKSYMAVVPVEQVEDEEVEVYAFRYESENDDISLFPIESDEEWEMVEEMLQTISDEDLFE